MMTLERLDWLLENWAIWMRHDAHKLSYPSKSLCMSSGGASGDDEFENMCEDADLHCAQGMDSIVDSISKPQRTAINHVWLSVAHHYPTQALDYEEAIESLVKLCNKRGLI